ncbi:hypothetical protein ACFVWR_11655 [Leifsonia sp. NPDC058292]|uniref:hypothetical protein n=1 Tax=Leifsonia sp. NPDC058292 TaxID=3346428 RepID=UPI0036DDA6CE
MRKLFYASGYVLLGDSVCDALLQYAKALADVGKSDVVDVPSLSDEGVISRTQLLIGPASQLFAATALDRGADLDDSDAVASMNTKAASLRPPVPLAGDDEQLQFPDGGLS